MPVLLATASAEPSQVTLQFGDTWAVRSVFGGAVAAGAVRAARVRCTRPVTLADAFFSFTAPTPPGDAVAHVSWGRQGRRFSEAHVTVEAAGTQTLSAQLAFGEASAFVAPSPGAPPAWPTHRGFDNDIEWRAPGDWLTAGTVAADPFTGWVRARGAAARLAPDEWACIAADLIGPALIGQTGDEAFIVATATMSLALHLSVTPDTWLRQAVRAQLRERTASSDLALRTGDGSLVARSHQRAVIAPAGVDEFPRSVTAFANSAIGSNVNATD